MRICRQTGTMLVLLAGLSCGKSVNPGPDSAAGPGPEGGTPGSDGTLVSSDASGMAGSSGKGGTPGTAGTTVIGSGDAGGLGSVGHSGGRSGAGGSAARSSGTSSGGGVVMDAGSARPDADPGRGDIGLPVGSDARSGTAPAGTPAGLIPAGLPKHMLIGAFAPDNNETWMKKSGTKWDVRWVYLSGQHGQDWYNVWGYGSADGAFATDWFTQCDQQGFIPGIHLYNIGYGHDQGDAGLLTEIRDATFISNYFMEFKGLMQKAKTFGKPVIIVLEGDSFGMIEMLTKNDPNAAATIGSSGLADLKGLPDTVAGLGLAYITIRDAVGATNVAIGPDVPAYAANGDILNGDNTDLQSHVDYQMKFFLPFGFGDNATGGHFDFAASNPLSGDADYYRLKAGDSGRWWDASDTASINSKSFNRYAEWLRLFNRASGRRWVLHQIPVGNSNMLNVDSDCGSPTGKCTPRTGYKDNRAEYFLNYDLPSSPAVRDEHLAKFADAGVIGLLFGAGDGGSTTPYNDTWTDGQLFLKSRTDALQSTGGFTLP